MQLQCLCLGLDHCGKLGLASQELQIGLLSAYHSESAFNWCFWLLAGPYWY